MLPGGLGGRVVGQLVLEHDRAAVLAVPADGVLLEVLDEEPSGGDVVAVTTTPLSGVARPADAVPWSARHAQMSSRITLSLFTRRLTVALPTCGPPTRKKRRGAPSGRWVARAGVGSAADLEQNGRIDRARVEDEPGDLDAGNVADLHRDDAVRHVERRHAEAENDRVGAIHLDRPVDVVDARREEQVLPLRERRR